MHVAGDHAFEETTVPWTVRNHGGRYYVRSSRTQGVRHFQYFGKGPAAQQAAAEDAEKRHKQLNLVQTRRDDDSLWRRTTAPLDQLNLVTMLLMRAALYVAGYHRHDGGEWRRKRETQ